jgi:hypothetical protein
LVFVLELDEGLNLEPMRGIGRTKPIPRVMGLLVTDELPEENDELDPLETMDGALRLLAGV